MSVVFFMNLFYKLFWNHPDFTFAYLIPDWVKKNIDFLLGDNNERISFLVGYGNDSKMQVHYAGYCPIAPEKCDSNGWSNFTPNRN